MEEVEGVEDDVGDELGIGLRSTGGIKVGEE